MYPKTTRKNDILFEEEDEIYSKTGREKKVEEGSLRGWEEGLMDGYEEGIPEGPDDEWQDEFLSGQFFE